MFAPPVPAPAFVAYFPAIVRQTAPPLFAAPAAPARASCARIHFHGVHSDSGGGGGGGSANWRPGERPSDDGGGGGGGGGGGEASVLPFADRLLRANAVAAFAGWAVADLLEDRGGGPLLLTAPDLREAAHIGLFGFLVHGLGGTLFYTLLDEVVSGSTPMPVVIKTCIDALLFLPLLANLHDSYTDWLRSGMGPALLKPVRSREHSSVDVLRRRALWVPAQAVSFLLLPAWWRVPVVSIVMVLCSFLRLASAPPKMIAA
jgi:hypothetical protein